MLKIVVYVSPYIQSNNHFETIMEYIETDKQIHKIEQRKVQNKKNADGKKFSLSNQS